MVWKSVKAFPVPEGVTVDVFAKKWDYRSDSFVGKRFCDVTATRTRVITAQNPNPGLDWGNMLEGWHVVFWMDIPKDPKID